MRVYILSAYPTVRAGLRALMLEHGGWAIAGETSPATVRANGVDPLDQRAAEAPPVDVLLVDLDTSAGGEQLATLIQVMQPRAGVVAIGAVSARPEALATLAPGALGLGLLPRDATAEEIIAAVEAVSTGLIVLDRGTARQWLAATSSPAEAAASAGGAGEPATAPGEPLTARELEVLQLLAEGLPNKLIAARLHVSEHTAKFHVASIMTKLGAASRTEAVTLAARRGLLIL